MEAIRKTMLNMKKEREKAFDKADAVEATYKIAEDRLNKVTQEHNALLEECQKLEIDFKECSEEYQKTDKLADQKERDLCKTQIDANNIAKNIQEVDRKCDLVEKQLTSTLEKLDACNRLSDESGRLNRMMQSRAKTDKVRFKELEKIIKELTMKTEEAEFKIEENSEIIAIFEEDMDTAEAKGNNSDIKIANLQEELQVVQNNLKSLENSAEASRLAEIEFKRTISELLDKCKKTETRAMHGEMHVQKLLAEIDKLAGDIIYDQEKLRNLSFEMEATLSEFK